MLQYSLGVALLSLFGGTVASGAVHALTVAIVDAFDFPYEFKVNTAALSLGSALLVGVRASFLPALRASQLDPVKALRSK